MPTISFVVVTPSKELRIQDIRHAYLHYLIDPFGLKYAKQNAGKSSSWAITRSDAPLLPDQFKKDFEPAGHGVLH